jgi:hypothetical protein
MAITAMGVFAADSSAATWKFNATKSKTTSTNPIKSQTDVREATPGGGVKVTREGQLGDGTAVKGSFTYKYDGKEYPAAGLAFDTLSVKRLDANSVITWGAVIMGDLATAERISADGLAIIQPRQAPQRTVRASWNREWTRSRLGRRSLLDGPGRSAGDGRRYARGRALAACERGLSDATALAALEDLRREGERLGLLVAIAEIERAIDRLATGD